MQFSSFQKWFCETCKWGCNTTPSHRPLQLCPDGWPEHVFVVYVDVSLWRGNVVCSLFWLVGGYPYPKTVFCCTSWLRLSLHGHCTLLIMKYRKTSQKSIRIFPFQSMDSFLFLIIEFCGKCLWFFLFSPPTFFSFTLNHLLFSRR